MAAQQPEPEEEPVDAELVPEPGVELERVSPAQVSLFKTDDPVEVIRRATEVANALRQVITAQKLYKNISGRDHVLVEGWATLGSMLGVTGVVEWSRRVEPVTKYDVEVKIYTGPKGNRVVSKTEHFRVEGFDWEARVKAVTADGRVIGAAEAMCSRKESSWKQRDDFALRSMAQTRAMSKALRGPLGFVVTLAGYAGTPADEMQESEADRARAERPPPVDPEESIGEARAVVMVEAIEKAGLDVGEVLAGVGASALNAAATTNEQARKVRVVLEGAS